MSDTKCKTCKTCAWLLAEDDGYTNWTVLSTDYSCLISFHPALPGTSETSTDEPDFKHAEKCNGYREGNPIEVDVDYERIPAGEYFDLKRNERLAYYTEDPTTLIYLQANAFAINRS